MTSFPFWKNLTAQRGRVEQMHRIRNEAKGHVLFRWDRVEPVAPAGSLPGIANRMAKGREREVNSYFLPELIDFSAYMY
jgi:hypothetical protein